MNGIFILSIYPYLKEISMNCKYCDTPITPVRASGRRPVYCSALCRKRSNRDKNKVYRDIPDSNRDQRDSNRDTESVTIDPTLVTIEKESVTIENAPVTIDPAPASTEQAPAKEILYCGCGAEAYGRLPGGYPSCIDCAPAGLRRRWQVWPPPGIYRVQPGQVRAALV